MTGRGAESGDSWFRLGDKQTCVLRLFESQGTAEAMRISGAPNLQNKLAPRLVVKSHGGAKL